MRTSTTFLLCFVAAITALRSLENPPVPGRAVPLSAARNIWGGTCYNANTNLKIYCTACDGENVLHGNQQQDPVTPPAPGFKLLYYNCVTEMESDSDDTCTWVVSSGQPCTGS